VLVIGDARQATPRDAAVVALFFDAFAYRGMEGRLDCLAVIIVRRSDILCKTREVAEHDECVGADAAKLGQRFDHRPGRVETSG
jgi:hypothetical protein